MESETRMEMTDEIKKRQQKHFMLMTETPVWKLIAKLSVPTVLSMMVTNIYNMADTAFVGKLGNSASGAIGIVFGYMAILQAVAFMFGQGAGSLMSRKLGEKDLETATEFTSTGFFLSFFGGAVISLLSLIFLKPLIYLLGSTETIEPYAGTYLCFIALAAPFMTSSLTMNNLLRYEGKAKLGMIGLLTGSVLNIFGDALFIFVFKMGIVGAGLATAITQTISFGILYYMFATGKTQTKISLKRVNWSIKRIGNICGVGFPSLLRQALNSVSTMLLNGQASAYGDEAVAAMSIVSRISFLTAAVAIGIGQGFQPVSSFNFGAKKYARVRQAFWFTFALSEVVVILMSIPMALHAPFLVRLFRDDDLVVIYGTRALILQCIATPFMPLTMVTEMGFQSTGLKVLASLSSSMRSGILFIPLLLILSSLRGMNGIEEAQPLSFIVSLFICFALSYYFLRFLKKKEREQ